MKYAVVYYSKYGQTREIAEYLVSRAKLMKEQVESIETLEVTSSRTLILNTAPDVVILGCPVYAGNFSRKFIRWTQKNRKSLEGKRLAIYTVSLNVVDKRPEARAADDQLLQKLIFCVGLVPDFVASFAGALKFTKYGWLKKAIMRRISKSADGPTNTNEDFEFTNWLDVESFLRAIVHRDHKSKYALENRFSWIKNDLKIEEKLSKVKK